ncbi:MAG TPA: carboxypeptidase regulatory-like domain-containing protein [Kofleriaceae bacterium]|nr:carboxypeptidase regulatory-like domain-containing protein [Kofleriaceae bacterium]
MERSRRGVSIGIVVVLLAAGALAWRRCGGGESKGSSSSGGSGTTEVDRASADATRAKTAKGGDPHGLARGSIAGTIKDEHGAPVASAVVCADYWSRELSSEETRDPICTTSDATGAYRLGDLLAATYRVQASAGPHGSAVWEDADHHNDLRLAAGEARTGVDLALPGGAIEIKGIVSDINGGPIGGALVRVSDEGEGWWDRSNYGGYVKTKDDGTFSVYAKPGDVRVYASAEGYSPGSKPAVAPGTFVEVLLTPEGVIAGTVVEAGTKKPVAGALVSVDTEWEGGNWEGGQSARTDDNGKFRLTRVKPGRYKPTAQGPDYYGEPAESVLLALGQTIEDVVIEVHPAVSVRGKVVIETEGKRTPCARASLWINDAKRGLSRSSEADPDGTVVFKAVLPGTYSITVWCEDELSKDHYDPIVVAMKDVDGLEWAVSPGGVIRGRVHTTKGEPIADAQIQAQTKGGDPRGQRTWGWKKSEKDGTFVVRGLVAGSYGVRATANGYPQPKDPVDVVVPAKGEATADIALDGGGAIHGVVVDEDGHGVGDVNVRAQGERWSWWGTGAARTADDGSFTIKGAEPGPVRVIAQRNWQDELRNPGSHDDDKQGKKVTVVAGQTVEVRLVVERQSGAITGVVVGGEGAPVSDAYLTATRESDAAGAAQGSALRESRWGDWDKRPVVTATDGSFKIGELGPGSYTVRAYRKGGGEAVVEHVAVGTKTRLVMKSAGSIAGTVVISGGGAPDVFFVAVSDRKTGFSRSEGFYSTAGAWAMRDLPAGTYDVTVNAAEGRASVDVPLADGEKKDGVVLALEKMVTVRGRMIELGGGAPISGLAVMVGPAKGDEGFTFNMDDASDPDRKYITDKDGRFEVQRSPLGRDFVTAFSMDWDASPWGWVRKLVIVKAGADVIDLGDIEVAKRRVPARTRGGDLGFDLKQEAPDIEPEQSKMEISHLDADGPAVSSGLKIGDVIVSIDGVDVRGERSYLAWTLMQVAPGTIVKLGLERGTVVPITAGPPS